MVTMIMEALKSVRNAHFFTTERGYQGEFLAELRRFLPGVGLPGDAIVEQEYQKRLAAHGINVRPDLIIHIPTPVGQDRRRDNFVRVKSPGRTCRVSGRLRESRHRRGRS